MQQKATHAKCFIASLPVCLASRLPDLHVVFVGFWSVSHNVSRCHGAPPPHHGFGIHSIHSVCSLLVMVLDSKPIRCCVWVGCGSFTRCLCWCFDVGTSRLVGLRGQVSQPLFSDRGGFRSSEWDALPLQLQRSTAIKDSMSPNSIPLPPERPSWKAQGPCWAWNPNDNIESGGLFALAHPHSSTESIVPRTEGETQVRRVGCMSASGDGRQQALCSARWGEKGEPPS